MNNQREAFEAWAKDYSDEFDFTTTPNGTYVDHSTYCAFIGFMATLASQAQQPKNEDQRANLVVNMIKYLGATKKQAKAIVDGVFDGEHTINESDLLPSQEQKEPESRWISADERLPEKNGDLIILYWPYNKKENKRVVSQAHFYDGSFFDEDGNDHYWPSHWMSLPPAPEGEKE